MIALGRRYVQYINKIYRRTGTLWDSRYKSSLVQTDRCLLLCYIELNPVRAGMAADPAHYRLSSYRANGLGQVDRRLTPHEVYRELAPDTAQRLARYRALFRSELDAEANANIRHALNQSQPLGDSRFYAEIEAATGIRREPRPRGRPAKDMKNEETSLEEQRWLDFWE